MRKMFSSLHHHVPLFVNAGSIFPVAESVEYTEALKSQPVTLLVYLEMDAEFTLYDDEDDGYGYGHGRYSKTTFKWDDTSKKLSLVSQEGSLCEMTRDHNFIVHVQHVK